MLQGVKRNKKLIFKILDHIERVANSGTVSLPDFDGYKRYEVEYHTELCIEAGLLKTEVVNKTLRRRRKRVDVAGSQRVIFNARRTLELVRAGVRRRQASA